MIVDCAHYVDGSRQSDRTISSDEAALQIYQGGFVWLGMFEPSGEELDEVRYTVITKFRSDEDADLAEIDLATVTVVTGGAQDDQLHAFGLHELAVEDAKSFHLRPKVEEYESAVSGGTMKIRAD